MGRPERRSADYFPFYAKDGRTLFMLESKYKCKGTGFFTNVMRFLTLETDHHVSLQDESDRAYFFAKCHCDEESGDDMLSIMSKTGKINKELWEINIIASQDLLDSISDAYRNRTTDIITMPEIIEKYIPYARNELSDVRNPQDGVVSDAINPQSKVKKRKLNKKFIPPSLDDVLNYFKEKGYRPDIAKKAFEYYDSADWKDARGNQVKNWKQKMIAVWFKDENKQPVQSKPMTEDEIKNELDRNE